MFGKDLEGRNRDVIEVQFWHFEGMRITMKMCGGRWCPGQDLNWVLPHQVPGVE